MQRLYSVKLSDNTKILIVFYTTTIDLQSKGKNRATQVKLLSQIQVILIFGMH